LIGIGAATSKELQTMAIYYEFGADTKMSVSECVKKLILDLDLKHSPEGQQVRLYNDGVSVTVLAGDANPFGRKLALQAFGFTPTLYVSFRPRLGGPHMELGAQTIMRVVDLLLRTNDGDAGFAVEFERVLLLRRSGRLYARDTFENHLNPEDLAMISLPYERKALRP
jgi:hypothetical protein